MLGESCWFAPLALLAVASSALAQQSADTQKLELRVVSGEAGRATLDRGRIDGLRAGDRIVLRPREGLPIEGRVLDVSERGASVEFDDSTRSAPPGTRGEAWIPRERLGPANPVEPAPGAPAPVEHPAWPTADQQWKQGMPLLTEVPALHPSQRGTDVSGRWYVISEHLFDLDGERSYGLDRAGLDLDWSNPFKNGADLHLAGEFDWRNAVVPDPDDEHEAGLRLDRLSYVAGGNRFESERLEFGRFLQDGLPEFGVLDGVEWSARASGGSSYGASLGYMPDPDLNVDSFRDLQVAAWYRWVADESERSVLQVGYQKTFHDYTRDRDLVVARVDLVPEQGWDLHGSAWVDLYTSHDEAKGAGVELTQGLLSLGRRFEGGSTLDLTATHMAFPEQDRFESPLVSAAQLADDHAERLALRGRLKAARHLWLREEIGVWSDQDDDGGDAEAGLELEEAFFGGSRARVSGFAGRSATSTLWAARISLGRVLEQGSWDLGYEFTQYDFIGFTDANDQLPEHRLHMARDFHSDSGWSFSVHAEWLHWAEEDAVSAGIYLQWSF